MESEKAGTETKLSENNEETLLPEVAAHNSKRFRTLFTVEPILLALFIAEGLSVVVTTNFILMRTCEIHFNYNKSVCSQLNSPNKNVTDLNNIVQPYSVIIYTGMNILSVLFPAIMSFFLGTWSDYNGRKCVIIIPSLGYCLKYIMLGVWSFFPNLGPEYGLLVVLPVALSGGFVNIISAVYAYVSDISSEDSRSSRIGLLEAVLYGGLNIGFLAASYVFTSGGAYGYILIYGLSAFIVFIAVIFTYFFVPESVQTTHNGKGLLHVFEYKHLKEMLQISFKKRGNYRRTVILLSIASLTITSVIGEGESNILFFFTKLYFAWDVKEFSYWLSVVFITAFFGIFLGIYLLMKWLKISDAKLGMLIYGLKAVNSFYIAFIPSEASHLMYYSALINIFGGLSSAIGRSILSKVVPNEDLGKIFALTATTESVFPLALGPLYTVFYNSTIKLLPGAFLFLSGFLFILCFVFYGIVDFIQKSNAQARFSLMENESENESG